MVFDSDRHAGFLGCRNMGLHLLGELFYGCLQFRADEIFGALAAADQQLRAELTGHKHLVLQSERAEIIVR